MRRFICGIALLTLFGGGAYLGYKKYGPFNASANQVGDDDYWAGLNFGSTGWMPQLPIHPRSMLPVAEGIYGPPKITAARGKAWSMQPSRTTDYMNPSQAVPTTGPGNLAPIPGVNTGFVNADATTKDEGPLIQIDSGSLIQGPLSPIPVQRSDDSFSRSASIYNQTGTVLSNG